MTISSIDNTDSVSFVERFLPNWQIGQGRFVHCPEAVLYLIDGQETPAHTMWSMHLRMTAPDRLLYSGVVLQPAKRRASSVRSTICGLMSKTRGYYS